MARGVPLEQGAVARPMLTQFADDPITAHHLRSYCEQLPEFPDLTRCTNEQVIGLLTGLVDDGRIRLGYLPPHDRMEGFAPQFEAPAPAPAREPAKKSAAPASKAPAPKQKCTNPACADAFSDASSNGTPLVTADAEGC